MLALSSSRLSFWLKLCGAFVNVLKICRTPGTWILLSDHEEEGLLFPAFVSIIVGIVEEEVCIIPLPIDDRFTELFLDLVTDLNLCSLDCDWEFCCCWCLSKMDVTNLSRTVISDPSFEFLREFMPPLFGVPPLLPDRPRRWVIYILKKESCFYNISYFVVVMPETTENFFLTLKKIANFIRNNKDRFYFHFLCLCALLIENWKWWG